MNRWTIPFVPLIALGTVWLTPNGARAQEVSVAGNNEVRAVECDGGDAVVRGNDNRLTLHGNCRSLLLEGNNNDLHAQLAAGAPITVRGNGNVVHYRAAGRTQASVQAAGNGNTVTADAGIGGPSMPSRAAAGAPLALREENMRRDVDCTGRDVLVEGNGDQYTLHGGCHSLTVRGEGLVIRADMQPGARITLQGNGDTVNWSVAGGGAPPVTSVDGEGSQIVQAEAAMPEFRPSHHFASGLVPIPQQPLVAAESPATPVAAAPTPALAPALPPPTALSHAAPAQPPHPAAAQEVSVPSSTPHVHRGGTLIVRGDHEARDVDCDGRDARVEGSYGIIVLRGDCQSVLIHGDSNKVQAEVVAGSRLTINGASDSLAYAVTAPGPDPLVAVTGQGSRAWRIPKLGDISPAGAAEGESISQPPNHSTGEGGAAVPRVVNGPNAAVAPVGNGVSTPTTP